MFKYLVTARNKQFETDNLGVMDYRMEPIGKDSILVGTIPSFKLSHNNNNNIIILFIP